MTMEVMIIFRQITKLAKEFDLDITCHSDFLCVRNGSKDDEWENYLDFEIDGPTIIVLFINSHDNPDGLKRDSYHMDQVAMGDPKCFDKIRKILSDWYSHE